MEEMTASQVAKREKINNTPSKHVRANLIALCRYVLEPVRKAWGGAIIVTSGYRSPALNARVGGAKTSQHTKGQAVDIKAANGDQLGLLNCIEECMSKDGLKVDQLINEYPDENGVPSWVHVSFRTDNKNRGQKLTIR